MTGPNLPHQRTALTILTPTQFRIGVTACAAVGLVLAQLLIAESGLRLNVQLGITWVGVAVVLTEAAARRKGKVRQRYLLAVVPMLALWGMAVLLPPLRAFFIGGGVAWILVSPVILGSQARWLYRRAVGHVRNEDYRAAIAEMDRLIALEPDVAGHFDFRGQIHQLAGDLRQAEADYREALRLAPESMEARLALVELAWQAEDLTGARRQVAEACESHSSDPAPFLTAGLIEIWDRQYDAALPLLEQAARQAGLAKDDRALLYFWLAFLRTRAGEREQALASIEHLRRNRAGADEWRQIAPVNPVLPLNTLAMHMVMGVDLIFSADDPVEALAHFEKLLRPFEPVTEHRKRNKRDKRR